jgi:two-component system, chemotaxis family, chemotaxis protein CheY
MPQKRTSVLIVDDNDMMRSILRGILRGEAYEVVGEARTGSIAIEMAERLHPKIICLDVMMPEMDGLEALPALKAAHPEIQIVMITSNADPETVQESIRNGASGYIVKPFNAAKVLDTLGKCASRLRPRQAST